jgi:hypothetical protein
MRRRTFWLLALLMVGALGVPPASDAARRSKCEPKRSTTILATGSARIFAMTKRRGEAVERRVFGCLYRKNKRYLLSELDDDGYYATGAQTAFPLLLGRRVAYVSVEVDTARSKYMAGSPAPSVRIVSLRNGRLIRNATLPENVGVSDFDASPSNAMAWIEAAYPPYGGTPSYRVSKLDAAGQTLLDAGAGVSGDSLAISGSAVYWTSGGMPHSATLATG